MTRFDRRKLLAGSVLTGTSASLAASGLPAWIGEAFAGPQDKPKKPIARSKQLEYARRRAVARGKPLLVLIVPSDPGARWQRGSDYGALLNHGGDGFLLDLALCEVSCAAVADVVKAFPGAKLETGKDEPTALLIETRDRAATPKITPVGFAFTPLKGGPVRRDGAGAKAMEEHLKAQNRALAAVLRRHIAKDVGMLSSRADQVRGQLADDEREKLASYLAGKRPVSIEFRLQVAAILRVEVLRREKGGEGKRLLAELRTAAHRNFVKARLDGAKWATSTGCGMRIEGEKAGLMPACGMGFTPALSRRFLYFYNE